LSSDLDADTKVVEAIAGCPGCVGIRQSAPRS
jgi:hypothetical protein